MDGSPNGSTPLNANGKPFHKVHHFCLHTINNANNVIQEECVKRERNVRKESSTTKETKYENDSKATENDRNEHKKNTA